MQAPAPLPTSRRIEANPLPFKNKPGRRASQGTPVAFYRPFGQRTNGGPENERSAARPTHKVLPFGPGRRGRTTSENRAAGNLTVPGRFFSWLRPVSGAVRCGSQGCRSSRAATHTAAAAAGRSWRCPGRAAHSRTQSRFRITSERRTLSRSWAYFVAHRSASV